jgi:signal transduction histidine kinase
LALAAHELRTPLHVLGAALEVLAGMALAAEAVELVATARRNVEWLGRSVAAMTDLVRLSQPGLRRRRTLCLTAVVRRVVADVEPFCARRGLALVVDAPATCPVEADGDDLQRALLNLCLNAIRFTPDGGRVTITLVPRSDTLELIVSDTGIGIPQALQPRLGEPFVTGAPLDSHHSDRIAFGAGGIGLGLAVVRAIASDHGGALRITSEEGCGTIAALVLPVNAAAGVPID